MWEGIQNLGSSIASSLGNIATGIGNGFESLTNFGQPNTLTGMDAILSNQDIAKTYFGLDPNSLAAKQLVDNISVPGADFNTLEGWGGKNLGDTFTGAANLFGAYTNYQGMQNSSQYMDDMMKNSEKQLGYQRDTINTQYSDRARTRAQNMTYSPLSEQQLDEAEQDYMDQHGLA